MHRFACPPNVVAERRGRADALDDDERRGLVEIEAAVLLGHARCRAGPSSPPRRTSARASSQSLALEAIEVGQHLVLDELRGRLRHQAMLVGELLRREDVGRRGVSSSSHEPPLRESGSAV